MRSNGADIRYAREDLCLEENGGDTSRLVVKKGTPVKVIRPGETLGYVVIEVGGERFEAPEFALGENPRTLRY